MADIVKFPTAVDERFTAPNVIARLEQYCVASQPPDVSLMMYDFVVAGRQQGLGLHTMQQMLAACWKEWDRIEEKEKS